MRHRPGKIYGQTGLFLMTSALLLLLTGGGIAIGVTQGRVGEIGRAIKAAEAEQKKLKDENRFIGEKMDRVRDSISLKESVTGRLQSPAPEQVVVVRRTGSPDPVVIRNVPRDPRFAALDIAFIGSAPAGRSAVR